VRDFIDTWRDAFKKHKLLTYATTIGMRATIGFLGLAFLTLAVLRPLGEESVWRDHLAPALEPKVTEPTFVAFDAAVEKIFASDSSGLIAFAAALALWEVSGAVRAVMDALNSIVDAEETRPTALRYGLSFVLALAVMALVACALFVVAVFGRLLAASGGSAHWLVAVLRWPAAAFFLGVAVGIVARFGPVEHRGARWASVGATLIVLSWLAESALYAWYFQNIADFKSASGNLLLIITVLTYFYISSIVFLVGAQLDELLREEAGGESHLTAHGLIRRAFSS
jgi:membrane protein